MTHTGISAIALWCLVPTALYPIGAGAWWLWEQCKELFYDQS
jgi:hypothetical protein